MRRDQRGRVVDIDPELGAAEWRNGKSRLSHAELRGKRTGATAPAAERTEHDTVANVTRRLSAIAEAELAEVTRLVVDLVPHAVAGTIEALRGSGIEPTEAAIAEALDLDFAQDQAIDVYVALHDIVTVGDRPGSPIEQARQAGSDAVVAWRCRGKSTAGGES